MFWERDGRNLKETARFVFSLASSIIQDFKLNNTVVPFWFLLAFWINKLSVYTPLYRWDSKTEPDIKPVQFTDHWRPGFLISLFQSTLFFNTYIIFIHAIVKFSNSESDFKIYNYKVEVSVFLGCSRPELSGEGGFVATWQFQFFTLFKI